MKTLLHLTFLSVLLSAATAFAGSYNKNIVETAVKDGNFKTLVSLVQAAGLADTLASGGPFTLFAPTDEAFAKIPAKDLASLKADKQKLSKRIKIPLGVR